MKGAFDLIPVPAVSSVETDLEPGKKVRRGCRIPEAVCPLSLRPSKVLGVTRT